ncbi:MAG: EamA family transporter RarD [Deltaproteobacteria bacterium]
MSEREQTTQGLLSALGAFLIWGLLPIYWKLFAGVAPTEVIAQRILWTALLTVALLTVAGRAREVVAVFATKKGLLATVASSFFISMNGLVFVIAVSSGRITEVSLGYYVNPLLNALLGVLVLRERPTPRQAVAIGLATIGVVYATVSQGGFPWISIALAGCFGLYGLVRKVAPAEALPGLAAEMTLAAPVALIYLCVAPPVVFGAFVTEGPAMAALLATTGVASAMPLYLFTRGARKLPYITIGLLMYIAPTLQLLVAVIVYGEPFTKTHAVTFGFIWVAIALYVSDLRKR